MEEQPDYLTVEYTLDRDTAIVHVIGEMDIATREIFTESTQAAVAAGARSLILDLSAVTFMDSSGISALIDSRSIAQVMLRKPSEVVERLIATTGLTDILAKEP